jgi:hypothetical protein
MLKQRTKIFIFFLYLGDLAATVLAFLCAYWFRGIFPQESYAKLFPFAWYNNLLLAIFPAWSFLFYLMGLYRNWRGQDSGKRPGNYSKPYSSLLYFWDSLFLL